MRALACILAVVLMAVALLRTPAPRALMPPIEAELTIVRDGVTRLVPILEPIAALPPQIHARSYRYRRLIIAAANEAFGPLAPAALLAAQIEAESAFRSEAVSPAGARGPSQIMPATAKGLSARYPQLGLPMPHDDRFATRAQALYMAEAHAAFPETLGCERWAFSLSRYNGGGRALNKERAAAADRNRWFGAGGVAAERVARSPANWRENRGYVLTILRREGEYARAGYGGGVGCTHV